MLAKESCGLCPDDGKTVEYKQLADYVQNEEKMEFLHQILPKKITVKEFRTIMESLPDPDDSSEESTSSSASTSSDSAEEEVEEEEADDENAEEVTAKSTSTKTKASTEIAKGKPSPKANAKKKDEIIELDSD